MGAGSRSGYNAGDKSRELAMYLHNSWYVVAWSRDLAQKPLAITVMDEDLVVFRDPEGRDGCDT